MTRASRLYPTDEDWLYVSKPWTQSRFMAFHRLKQLSFSTLHNNMKQFQKLSAPNYFNVPFLSIMFTTNTNTLLHQRLEPFFGYFLFVHVNSSTHYVV